MPPRAIKRQLTCPIEITSGSSLIGRNGILVIPRNHLEMETKNSSFKTEKLDPKLWNFNTSFIWYSSGKFKIWPKSQWEKLLCNVPSLRPTQRLAILAKLSKLTIFPKFYWPQHTKLILSDYRDFNGIPIYSRSCLWYFFSKVLTNIFIFHTLRCL